MPTTSGEPFLFFVSLNYELHNQLCQNGFWFMEHMSHPQGGDAASQLTSLVGQFRGTVWPKFVAFQNNQVHYKSIVGVTMNPKNGPIVESIIESQTGAQPDESLPSYCAAVLSLRTGLGGRSNRGRLYIAGVGESDSTDSKLIPAAFSGLQAIGDELLARFGDASSFNFWSYVVWSRLRGGPVGEDHHLLVPAGATSITQCLPRINLGTQKHRQIGHGR